jgi:hypothetical protein
LGIAAFISGCTWTTQTGEIQQTSETIALQDVESADVTLRMGAGELTVDNGSEALMDAEFTFNVADWEPMIDYVVSGAEGELWIEQPEVKNLGLESYRYAWDLRFNETVPMQMDIALGAGPSEIDVSNLSVTRLDLRMGAGETRLDLSGAREEDLAVILRGGVGQATVILPADIGVRAEVRGGLGAINADGLMKDGAAYVNEAYGTSDITVTLDVEAGVGEINLQVTE